jgi:dTDP-4-amino-4,6-dideoxygalactose transaminase
VTGDSLPFSRPSLGEAEIREVVDVLRSGWITSGPRVQRFESDFAAYVGSRHAVSVTSCTAGLHLALLAHGIGPGDDVVTTAMTWPTTVNVIELVGARPVFADVDPGTLQLEPGAVEAARTPSTRAILPVHFGGQACDLDALGAIASAHGLLLIEDAAHAVGTEYRGRRIGSGGNLACFSFHPIKNITTAEGGMVTTDDPALAESLRLLRFHGVNRDAWSRYSGGSSPRYETVRPGFKYNLTDVQAALGIHQLARLDGFIERRSTTKGSATSTRSRSVRPRKERPGMRGTCSSSHSASTACDATAIASWLCWANAASGPASTSARSICTATTASATVSRRETSRLRKRRPRASSRCPSSPR